MFSIVLSDSCVVVVISTHFQVLKGAPIVEGRPGEGLPSEDFEQIRSDLKEEFKESQREFSEADAVSAALYPEVFRDFIRFRDDYGIVRQLPTRIFFNGPKLGEEFEVELEVGNKYFFKVLAISDLMDSGEREVFFSVNGQTRSVLIVDKDASKVGRLLYVTLMVASLSVSLH